MVKFSYANLIVPHAMNSYLLEYIFIRPSKLYFYFKTLLYKNIPSILCFKAIICVMRKESNFYFKYLVYVKQYLTNDLFNVCVEYIDKKPE